MHEVVNRLRTIILQSNITNYYQQSRSSVDITNQIANENEHANGIMMLGYCHFSGIGTKVDKQKAVELYQKAANLGNNAAQYNLALMYENGEGVDKEFNKAFELFKKSAEEGYSNGITRLGHCYQNGVGTNINKHIAFELYLKAANLGNVIAQYNLALMYETGDGIAKDINKAIYWYKNSAEHGYQDAQNRLEKLLKIMSVKKNNNSCKIS
jgi:TPR repeat protein